MFLTHNILNLIGGIIMKIAYRRLIAGIFLIINSFYSFYRAKGLIGFVDKFFQVATRKELVSFSVNFSSVVLIAFCELALGIFFIATCSRTPIKKVEFSLPVAAFVFQFIAGFIIGFSGNDVFPVTYQIMTPILVWALIGIAYGKGYHALPFKDDGSLKKQPKNVSLVVDSNVPDELAKYKKLLDENTITQEEFEAKKKQLLDI